MTVEAQRFEDYGRIIVTFPDRFTLPEHDVTSENGVLVIAFDAAMDAVVPDFGTVLGEYVAIARMDPDRRAFRMGLRKPLQVNTIVAGEQLYVDLLPEDWVGLPPSLPEEVVARLAERAEEAEELAAQRRRAELVEEYNPTATVHVGRHPTFTRILFDWNVGTTADFARDEEGNGQITFDWPVPVDLYQILSDLPEELAGVENTVSPAGSVVALELATETGIRFYSESPTTFVLDIDRPDIPPAGIDLASLDVAGEEEGGEASATAENATDTPAVDAAMVDEITPFVTRVGATERIVFPFPSDVPAAVFKRGYTVWLIFDTEVRINAPEDRTGEQAASLVDAFSVQGTGNAQVIRLALDEDRLATIGSEGRAWVLSLGDVLLNATEALALERRMTDTGLYEITANLGQPAHVHELRDPDVGDVLEVVTAYPPAKGIVRDLNYVDFSAPRTVHGLVIRPLHEQVEVTIEDHLAVVSAVDGLTVSPADELRYRTPTENRETALDLIELVAETPDAFFVRRDDIMNIVAEAEGNALDRARLMLAQFYLANGLAHESLGVLSVLDDDLRLRDIEPVVMMAEAAANVAAHRPEAAMDILEASILSDQADAMVWRAIARTELGDYDGARLDALGAQAVIALYPRWVRTRFHLAAARAAIERGDEDNAAAFLGNIEMGMLARPQLAEYELLGGMLDELGGRHTEALESYGRVINIDNRPTTAEAVLRTIKLLDKMERLDVARAVDTLSVQATLWRGDQVELGIIEKLTDLQYRNGNYREALNATRQAAAMYDDTTVIAGLVERARDEFTGLFLDGEADRLDAVSALSIYYDFRHLTPPGTEGDLMIRNLAQRLIKVDLLDQASELLRYQIDHRLEGAARAQVAADLAIVYIANRQPGAALQVLGETRISGLPVTLDRQRRVLEARALIDANRNDLALDLLSGVTGRDTELLRIEALWNGEHYSQASELIELLYAPDLEDGQLSPVARTQIVKAAVGYVLAQDQLSLSRLRGRYSEAMSRAPEWPMFDYVTSTVEPAGGAFRDIARQVAGVDSLNAFLNAYRQAYTAQDALTPLRAVGATGNS
ncbi:hypothetical protein [Pelagibacterium xiamenense]|uniref:hypothetical protein n=1 Tax=Pelagibacterium xiamenense TaxID=2901140 RepID=UPI001E46EEF1|nr:hypothetical protein [Pelagibacterium xiamenense]MCD7060001.1 hypothetical protein [Pelagibacterium xiamenense]